MKFLVVLFGLSSLSYVLAFLQPSPKFLSLLLLCYVQVVPNLISELILSLDFDFSASLRYTRFLFCLDDLFFSALLCFCHYNEIYFCPVVRWNPHKMKSKIRKWMILLWLNNFPCTYSCNFLYFLPSIYGTHPSHHFCSWALLLLSSLLFLWESSKQSIGSLKSSNCVSLIPNISNIPKWSLKL